MSRAYCVTTPDGTVLRDGLAEDEWWEVLCSRSRPALALAPDGTVLATHNVEISTMRAVRQRNNALSEGNQPRGHAQRRQLCNSEN